MLMVSVLGTMASPCRAVTPPIVRVYVAGSPEAVSGSREALEDRCARSEVAVVVRDAAGADEALLAQSPAPGLAQAYVDLRPGSAPRVVVVDGETRKDLERRSLPEDASLEISIETAAHVVCAAVESLLATRAAAPPPPPPQPVPPPAPAAAREQPTESAAPELPLDSKWSSQLNLFATGANLGAGFQFGGGASFGLTHGNGALRFGALLSISGYPAADVEAEGAVANVGVMGARLLPMIEWHATQVVRPFVALGGGADWMRVAAEYPPPGTMAQAASTSVDAIAAGMLGVRFHLGSSVAALLALDADVALTRHSYVIETPQGRESFFEPARVRPVALSGLSVSWGGDTRPSSQQEARR
ncbi:MAG TPA: hypothetical protein VER04_12790 [Polyangiaceae bacterium]|nr:hypothetical protein [Polyangiaceae bacterium]